MHCKARYIAVNARFAKLEFDAFILEKNTYSIKWCTQNALLEKLENGMTIITKDMYELYEGLGKQS